MIHSQRGRDSFPEVIGLLPAGGGAKRIAPLPCSKELFPIGFRPIGEQGELRPKVACHYLLEKMSLAGIGKVYIILRMGKWDIPNYLGDGSMLNMHFAYLMVGLPYGTPFTVDQAYPFVQNTLVAFGFPDIIFDADDAFVRLLERQAETKADVILGLFPAHRPDVMDMVEVHSDGRIRSIVIKPLHTDLHYTWIVAVWTPTFTRFLHDYLMGLRYEHRKEADINVTAEQELSVGHIFQAAIREGLQIQSVSFPGRTYLDIGTPDNLVKAVSNIKFNPDNSS